MTKAQERPEDKAAKKDPLLGLAHSPIPNNDLPLKLWARVSPPEAAATTARIGLWLESIAAIGADCVGLDWTIDIGTARICVRLHNSSAR